MEYDHGHVAIDALISGEFMRGDVCIDCKSPSRIGWQH